MAKVTSNYQVRLPKAIVEKYNIRPGDNLDLVAAGKVIRVVPHGGQTVAGDLESRLRAFDQATERLRRRSKKRGLQRANDRGWTREDLYTRGCYSKLCAAVRHIS